ncbi:MAG: hypothetical protein WC587_02445 [Candidatus Paceibacterota bacterium]
MTRMDFEIFAAIAFIVSVVYLNKKEEVDFFVLRFFTQFFTIITRRFTKKAGR